MQLKSYYLFISEIFSFNIYRWLGKVKNGVDVFYIILLISKGSKGKPQKCCDEFSSHTRAQAGRRPVLISITAPWLSPGQKTSIGREEQPAPPPPHFHLLARALPQGWDSLQLKESILYAQSASPASTCSKRTWQPPRAHPICP